jgi:hypothetical protein
MGDFSETVGVLFGKMMRRFVAGSRVIDESMMMRMIEKRRMSRREVYVIGVELVVVGGERKSMCGSASRVPAGGCGVGSDPTDRGGGRAFGGIVGPGWVVGESGGRMMGPGRG